ncbi:MAG: PIN domain-containing protein [Gammaproteobacteria bacterium]|nr:PIN domain-containing protein [Gammaproteobacteria bacterium]
MILTDTGFWLALINKRDKHHQKAISFISSCEESLVTTWPVITETCYMLGRALGVQSQTQFLQLIKSDLLSVANISSAHIGVIEILMIKYADLPMDLADASLVMLAEEVGHGRILSTDQRDFRTYRWKNHKPFENLLLPDDRQ